MKKTVTVLLVLALLVGCLAVVGLAAEAPARPAALEAEREEGLRAPGTAPADEAPVADVPADGAEAPTLPEEGGEQPAAGRCYLLEAIDLETGEAIDLGDSLEEAIALARAEAEATGEHVCCGVIDTLEPPGYNEAGELCLRGRGQCVLPECPGPRVFRAFRPLSGSEAPDET